MNNKETDERKSVSRRTFLRRLGWGGIVTFVTGNVIAAGRFFFPRVLFEPPARFKVGKPSDYPPSTVSTAFKDKFRVWIVRKDDGRFYCIHANCTHLGCTPNWKQSEGVFHCPCHGGKFRLNGTNFAGPPPRPLDRLKIALAPDGKLVVDKSIVFRGAAGKDSDELYPQSLLEVKI
jgi:cytochrome b6-f complex iron-sulfur subunit